MIFNFHIYRFIVFGVLTITACVLPLSNGEACGGAHENDGVYEIASFMENILNEAMTNDPTLICEEKVLHQADEFRYLPAWAEGDFQKVNDYYEKHEESKIDKLLRFIGSSLGVIVHGNINQDQLSDLLQSFDINKLIADGPYSSPVLSHEAQQLIYDSLQSLDRIFDIHLHNLGYDEGNYLNPRAAAQGVAAWKDYLTFSVLRYASGMSSPIGSAQEARRRIHLYAEHFPKLCGIILPIHKAILQDGTVDWNNTGSYLKNQSALTTALAFDARLSELIPAISVHPFDPAWHEKLKSAHSKGIRLVKWMPPQSIPPDSDLLDEYYTALHELDMTLIAHAGPEHAIPTNEENSQWADWGNPLRFRKPLQYGVNVILAHCGHKDEIPDLDHPDRPLIQGCQLFLRLARETHCKNLTGEWTGKLYGDLAAVTTHYGSDFVKLLLLHAHEEGVRLIYGSDYPYTNLVRPKNDAYEEFAKCGLLDSHLVGPLKEIRGWNPLLANFVFTRVLSVTISEGDVRGFPDCTFTGRFKEAELNLVDREVWAWFKNNQIQATRGGQNPFTR